MIRHARIGLAGLVPELLGVGSDHHFAALLEAGNAAAVALQSQVAAQAAQFGFHVCYVT